MCCEKLRKAVNRRSKRFSAIDFQSRAAKLDKTCVGRQMIYVLWHGAGITTLCRRWLWASVPGPGPRPVPARFAAQLPPVCGQAPGGLRLGSGYPAAWFLTGRSRRLGWGPRPGSETVPGGVSRAVPPLVLIQFPADSGYCIKLPAGSAKLAAGRAYSRPI